MQLLFADVAAGVDIGNVLAPWADDVAVVSCDPERCTAVATFTSEAAFADARARLGAGIRGRFAVKPPAGSQKASGASARAAAATRAREVDPWAESAAAQPQGQAHQSGRQTGRGIEGGDQPLPSAAGQHPPL